MSKKIFAWGGAGLITPRDDNQNNLGVTESFTDIMSEDLARNLQEIESSKSKKLPIMKPSIPCTADLALGDTSSDLSIAQMLQQEYDKEHDLQINRDEKFMNKNSNVAISLDKYRICPKLYSSDSEDETFDFDDVHRVLDSFEERKLTDPVFPACGYAKFKNQIITKHDSTIVGRKNAERIMNLPPGVNTGDGGSFNMQLTNRVFNGLKGDVKSGKKKVNKDKTDTAISDLALDRDTRLLLLKFVHNGILVQVAGTIAVGKESVVIRASGGIYNDTTLSEYCAIKVFKTCLIDFKTRLRYVKCDTNIRNKIPKNNTKKAIYFWAEKEFHNLHLLTKAGIPCPTPYLVKDHILIMSFVGHNQLPALKLKHVKLSFPDWCIAYEQVIEVMIKLYNECNLVHADLSEYNILWHDEKCWFIDVGQSVSPNSKDAFTFLLRDCTQMVQFFETKGVPEIPTPIELFNTITGFDIPNCEAAEASLLIDKKLDNSQSKKSMLMSDDHFEYLWNQTKCEKESE